MRAIFFGTPDIAVPALRALHGLADVVGVICQPDRPAGRGLSLRAPPVKEVALELGLEVHQPKRVKTAAFAEGLASLEADVALVIAYGRILPKAVLAAPRRGCMNLHASILPAYRGAAPINWAVVHGEQTTGVSLMQMDEGMDTGPVFAIEEIPIGSEETAGELYARLGELAAEVVQDHLVAAVEGRLEATAQDDDRASHARMLTKDDGRIAWSETASKVHDHIRGMTPWPGAWTVRDGARLKVLRARPAPSGEGPPGSVLAVGADGIRVACGTGAIDVLRAQLAGRKALDASQISAGRQLQPGDQLN